MKPYQFLDLVVEVNRSTPFIAMVENELIKSLIKFNKEKSPVK